MTKRVTLAIVLPSGVTCGRFSTRVVDGGEYLELRVLWPTPLVDIAMMHKKWIIPKEGRQNGNVPSKVDKISYRAQERP